MADSCLGPPLCKVLQHLPIPISVSFLQTRTSSRTLSMSSSPTSRCLCSSNPSSSDNQPSLLVFSGGTAFNGVVEELKKLTTQVAHVLPVSDDGGSTAEIVRVLGGPAVGDIRSRCLRLSDESTSEALAVRTLLGHRLPHDAKIAKLEWYNIVEGDHRLWNGVSKPYRETIRSFLAYFQNQSVVILGVAVDVEAETVFTHRLVSCRSFTYNAFCEIMRGSNISFCFSNGSIGNFFFAGARIFFESLDAAIFLFSRVSHIPTESLVLPVISTNDRLTLGCELQDGTIIRGQNEISHPTTASSEPIDKRGSSVPALPSRIKRVFYMSSEGCSLLHEVFPSVNPTVLDQLKSVDCIIYAMGSLFTSICPSLVLLGVGEIISSRSCPKEATMKLGYVMYLLIKLLVHKRTARTSDDVLLLNSLPDRETSGFSASCFVTAITDALNRTCGNLHNCLKNLPSDYINTLVVPKGGQIPVDIQCLAAHGIFDVISADTVNDPKVGIIFDPRSLIQALDGLLSKCVKRNVTVE